MAHHTHQDWPNQATRLRPPTGHHIGGALLKSSPPEQLLELTRGLSNREIALESGFVRPGQE
ncbi:hypothetical protein AB0K05_12385 [Nonomuraea sp. NPDC049486]|uniref:hypothetical protein n=1 Tax=Nonomuraea sp. NPDC049486 TaxID=3155773 RepID=UPI00341BCDA3